MSSGFEYWRKRHLEEQNAAHKLFKKEVKEILKETPKTKVEKPKKGKKWQNSKQ